MLAHIKKIKRNIGSLSFTNNHWGNVKLLFSARSLGRGQCRWLHHSYNGRASVLCYFTTLTPCARPQIAGLTFFFRNSRKKSGKCTNLLSGGSSSNSKDLKHQVGTSALESLAGGVIASHAKALHKTRHSASPGLTCN